MTYFRKDFTNEFGESSMHIMKEQVERLSELSMVLILDGNSEYVAHVYRKIDLFVRKKKVRRVNPLKLIKCLKHIKR